MCGFCGVVGVRSQSGTRDVERATRALSHRGPDDCGVWSERTRDAAHEVVLGHTRLAIIDLSPLGHQPMQTSDGRLTVAYNGELYNFQQLRGELERLGTRFRSDSDTEVVLEAFRTWGDGALEKLNGMFAFALWDAASERLLLARDPLGIKPLYWRHASGQLWFGSEICALRADSRWTPEVAPAAVGSYLRHGYVPGPASIFRGVEKLMPGHALAWKAGALSQWRYWRLEAGDPIEGPLDFSSCIDRLDKLLGDSVERQMISDVPIGAFLSGGIDSSAVVSLMVERARGRVQTFSIGFEEQASDEAPFARAVARHLGTQHEELYVKREDARRAAEELPILYDEPFADPSQLPTLLLSRMTRRHVKVALSGDGGDELFAGYDHYGRFQQLLPWLRLPRPLRERLAAVAPRFGNPRLRNALGHLGATNPASLGYRILSAFREGLLADLVGEEAARENPVFFETWQNAPADSELKRLLFADARVYLPDDILTKVDRASMSIALEVRVPLLDVQLTHFAMSLPLGLLWRGRERKAPLRAVAYRRVPRELLDRPKHGFGMPLHDLLADRIDAWSAHYLTPERLGEEGLLTWGGVQKAVAWSRAHPDPVVRYETLWRLVHFERWFAHHQRSEALV
jgi:asparagine synthase (glutamine-hydrolysing)